MAEVLGHVGLPSTTRILGSTDRGRLTVWDSATESELFVDTEESIGPSEGCSMSADGNRIFLPCVYASPRIWNLGSGKETVLSIPRGDTWASTFSSDGSFLAITRGYSIVLWDAVTGDRFGVLRGHADRVMACAFSPDGRTLLSGSEDTTAKAWDYSLARSRDYGPQRGTVQRCVFTADGKRVQANYILPSSLLEWDAFTGSETKWTPREKRRTWPHTADLSDQKIEPPQRWERFRSHAFSPNGDCVAWVESPDDACPNLADPADLSSESTEYLSDAGGACSFSQDCRRLASTSGTDMMTIWDVESMQELIRLEPQGSVVKFGFAPDDCQLISRAAEPQPGNLKCWNSTTGNEDIKILGHACGVRAFAHSPDGTQIVTASYLTENTFTTDPTIKLWSARTGNLIRSFAGHRTRLTDKMLGKGDGRFVGCNFFPDGKMIASASDDGTIKVWEVQSGRLLGVFISSTAFSMLALSPAGDRIAAIDESGEFYLLRLKSFPAIVPIVTGRRLYRCKEKCWDRELTARCAWCGERFALDGTLQAHILETLSAHKIIFGRSPCADMPKEAWHHPILNSSCPACHRDLHFNPFIVDNADTAYTPRKQPVTQLPFPEVDSESSGPPEIDIPSSLVSVLPLELCRRYLMVPLSRSGAKLTIAISDPGNAIAIADAMFVSGYEIEAIRADESTIKRTINRYYGQA